MVECVSAQATGDGRQSEVGGRNLQSVRKGTSHE